MILFRTEWVESTLQYHFSDQKLALYNFDIIGLIKFRHLAILAISPNGYFGYFSPGPNQIISKLGSFWSHILVLH